MAAKACPVLIGGAHIDRIGYALDGEATGTSAPGRVDRSLGGVAFNVARMLRGLGEDGLLVSAFGEDPDGRTLLAESDEGLDIASAVPAGEGATASYHAIINPDGTLLGAVADMAIYDLLLPQRLAPFEARIRNAPLVFVDANLPAATLAWIAGLERSGLFAADTVSTAKAGRLADILTSLDVIFSNRAEAGELTGPTPRDAAAGLCRLGAGGALVSDGAKALQIASDPLNTTLIPIPPARVVDETGAGDALVAGTLFGLLRGQDLDRAAQTGLAAARLCIETAGAALPNARADAVVALTKDP